MNNIKRILIVILALAAMAGACLVVTTYSEAKESQITEALVEEELEVIDGEEIGIVINTKETEEEVEIEEEEIIETPSYTEEDEDVDSTIEENEDLETKSPEVPEGLSEGYEEGVYFKPNCFDCELHEYCYKCEQHEIETEYFWDEDINPRHGWVYSETCIICGHGECRPATEDEIK